MKKNGIVFNSFETHRIKISNAKIMRMGGILYLNIRDKLIIISNVKDVKIYESFLYFTCLGKVEISLDLKDVFRYFALNIKSTQFSLDQFKQLAISDLMNNEFDINFSKIAKKYMKIIEKVLQISIFQEKIVVKPNKFKLSFELTYKLNNRIKHVIIN